VTLDVDEQGVREILVGRVLGRIRRRRGVGGGERLVGVLPEPLVGVPAPATNLGLETLVGEHRADHALGLGSRGGVLRVDVQPLAVAGDDHPVAEALGNLVIEIERPQPLAELAVD
jgi:hypothetical protein